METRCPDCQAEIPETDVDLERRIARCPGCRTVRGLPGPKRDPLPLAHHVSLHRQGDRLALSFRWRRVWMLHWLVILLMCAMTLWLLVGTMIFSPRPLHSAAARLLYYGAVLPVALLLALGCAYLTLARLVNRTITTVPPLAVRHGPLPWRPIPTLASDRVRLVCKEREHHGRGGTSCTYRVYAVADGRRVKLVDDLESPEQALFVEQEIAARLG